MHTRGERNRRSRRHVGVDSRRRTMRSEQEARDDKSDGNAQGLHTENGSRRRDRSSDDNGSEDGQHDQRRHESGDPERSQRMKQFRRAGRQPARDGREARRVRTRCRRRRTAARPAPAKTSRPASRTTPATRTRRSIRRHKPANRNRQPHGIERCIDEGPRAPGRGRRRAGARRRRTPAGDRQRGRRPGRRRTGPARGQRSARKSTPSATARAATDRPSAREDARGKGIGQLTRRARQACRVNHALDDGRVVSRSVPRNPGGNVKRSTVNG